MEIKFPDRPMYVINMILALRSISFSLTLKFASSVRGKNRNLRQKLSRFLSLFLDSSSESEISKYLKWKEKQSHINIPKMDRINECSSVMTTPNSCFNLFNFLRSL